MGDANSDAMIGENNRLIGLYPEAIHAFTKALKEEPLSPKKEHWLRAHLGATWGTMGVLKEATSELNQAIEGYYKEHNNNKHYAWAIGQLGEAYRLDALNSMPDTQKGHQLRRFLVAIALLSFALELKGEDPWIRAHHGAACMNAYWPALFDAKTDNLRNSLEEPLPKSLMQEITDRVKCMEKLHVLPDELSSSALHDLDLVCKVSPGYVWAAAMFAQQLIVAGNARKAAEVLAVAQAYDINQRLTPSALRDRAMLAVYQKSFQEGSNAASLAIAKDPDDVTAAYFSAIAVTKLSKAGMADKTVALEVIGAARRTQQRLNTWLGYIEIGLARLEHEVNSPKPPEYHEEFVKPMSSLLRKGDGESRAVFTFDPTWDEERTAIFKELKSGPALRDQTG